jgi:hypothetical protein
MRTIAEIPNPNCRITIFSWNQKYLIKLETPDLEQVYKVSEFDVSGDEAVKALITEEFIGDALRRFEEMRKSLDKIKR